MEPWSTKFVDHGVSLLSICNPGCVPADVGNYPALHARMQYDAFNTAKKTLKSTWIAYSVREYKMCYELSIRPLNDATQWDRSGVDPLTAPLFPPPRKGAKQTKRRKEAWELERPRFTRDGEDAGAAVTRRGTTMTCSACKKKGHNKRGCNGGGHTASTSTHATSRTPQGTARSPVPNGRKSGGGTSASGMHFMPTPRVPPSDSPARNTRSKTRATE
ncbi:hypothetical protein LINPERHAP1_LOCUS14781 [Linum perenne]